MLTLTDGQSFTQAAAQAGFKEADSVCKLGRRFHRTGLAALFIAAGRGRKATYTSEERQQILEALWSAPDREQDQSATWSLALLERVLRRVDLSSIGASTIRRVLHKAGDCFGHSRTWYHTGTSVRERKAGMVTVHDPHAQEKQRLIELAYRMAEAVEGEWWCQDEAGPYQAIPQPGEDWHLQGYPRLLPHEYARGGRAKLLTPFRAAAGQLIYPSSPNIFAAQIADAVSSSGRSGACQRSADRSQCPLASLVERGTDPGLETNPAAGGRDGPISRVRAEGSAMAHLVVVT